MVFSGKVIGIGPPIRSYEVRFGAIVRTLRASGLSVLCS